MKPVEEPERSELPSRTQPIPTRRDAVVFRAKATLLQGRRAAQDVIQGVRRFPRGNLSRFPYVLAESRTPLWVEESLSERASQLGKVQNLRCAVHRLNGIEIPACGVFSFWKHVGRATRRRGYVPGRLLREGCLIQAVGGGLCQLSNALYDLALRSNCEIVERWGHSMVVPGSAAETGRDATVAWNYIDLRFRPKTSVLVEAYLTSTELILRFRTCEKPPPSASRAIFALEALLQPRPEIDPVAHSCITCGQHTCFRHARQLAGAADDRTAWLIDECWPEFREYVKRHGANDLLGMAVNSQQWKRGAGHGGRYAWDTGGYAQVFDAALPALWRSWQARRHGRYGAARLKAQLDCDRRIALHLAKVLTTDTTHVVVAQSLLPYLWLEGYLGGRTFEVLMTRLPLTDLHQRLDDAYKEHPERRTLSEFRAPAWLVEAEAKALQAAVAIVTPHTEIASLFQGRAHLLPWHKPAASPIGSPSVRRLIAFPGPTAARKGAYELREAARRLDLEVVLCGTELEGDDFWDGIPARRIGANWLEGVCAVVQPALIEDQPRRLLAAMDAGVPVIATAACGLAGYDGVRCVPWGDVDALTEVLAEITGAQATERGIVPQSFGSNS